MNNSSQKGERKQKITEAKIFPVPFPLNENKEDLTINTNNPSKPSKEKIINQAFKFHSEGNIAEASKYYQYFLNRGFKDHRVFSNYGVILKGFGKLQEAELYTHKAIKINPNIANYYYNLGTILSDIGKLEEAESSYREAIQLNPNFKEAHLNLGNILRDLHKLKDAEFYARKAIELNPNVEKAYVNLANILSDLGNLKDAEESLRKAIELNPNYPAAHCNLGSILRNLGKLKDSETSTRKAIQLNPNFPAAHSNLGSILSDLGKLKGAEESLRKAIELNPDLPEAHSNLGELMRDLGKLEELILLSKSTLESRSINKGYKVRASLLITIANLVQGDFPETLLHLNKTKELISHGAINIITDEKNRKHTSNFFRFISSLYPQLEKKNNPKLKIIPHIGESHCLSFAHQTLTILSEIKKIQPVLITGAKAWHFANKKNNQWKDSLTQQIKNHTYSDEIFISFGEIDCRKDEGILNYAIKYDKDITEVCEKTINGYLDYMEQILSPIYSKKYYFGIPAPTREKELFDDLDIKRIKIVKLYNKVLKKEVLLRGSYFLDVYKLTSIKDGWNNNIYMCDRTHLSPKCLSILFENYLYKS